MTRTLLPAARLAGGASVRTVRKPGSILFDGGGNMFVTSELSDTGGNDARVLRYSAAQLATLTGDVPLEANVVIGVDGLGHQVERPAGGKVAHGFVRAGGDTR